MAIEARVIGEGAIDFRLLFITAQGFPAARFPADSRIDSHSRTIGTDWSLAGPELDLNSPRRRGCISRVTSKARRAMRSMFAT